MTGAVGRADQIRAQELKDVPRDHQLTLNLEADGGSFNIAEIWNHHANTNVQLLVV